MLGGAEVVGAVVERAGEAVTVCGCWAGETGLSEQVDEKDCWRSRDEVELAYRRWLPPW